jgi:hypothetical protein
MKVRGGEFSTGTMGNFQPELTRVPLHVRWWLKFSNLCQVHKRHEKAKGRTRGSYQARRREFEARRLRERSKVTTVS